jgi:23S rRNA pseudouridine1911/1915/1917 synthase
VSEGLVLSTPRARAGERVDRVVALLTGRPRAQVAALVADGAVRLSGRVVSSRSTRVTAGDTLEVALPDGPGASPPVAAEPEVRVPVVHADDWVIVVDKPPGLVVHPGAGNRQGTMVGGLIARFPELAAVGSPERPGLVHRLDRGSSGLLVVARTAAAHEALVTQLRTGAIERRYLVLVAGWPAPEAGVVDAPLGRSRRDPTRVAVVTSGREARTVYRVLERFTDPAPAALLRCRLETGRTHQIRVHLAAIGHPVVGDARYGGGARLPAPPRPFLHAAALDFDHPSSGERVGFRSALPADLTDVLDRFRPGPPGPYRAGAVAGAEDEGSGGAPPRA